MELSAVTETIWNGVAALGGVVAIAGLVSAWVSRYISSRWLQTHKGLLDRELETHRAALAMEADVHRLTLKRQELLFARELEAADAFMAMWRKIWPQYSRPFMEWPEACEDVACKLGSIEDTLEDYLESHSVAISTLVREQIAHAHSEAASEKFFDIGPDINPPAEAIKAAERVLESLKVARDAILTELRR